MTIDLAEVRVPVGVDTHADVHLAAAIDQYGCLLGATVVPSTASGHARLTAWAQALGVVDQVGVEGTGSYGAGLLMSPAGELRQFSPHIVLDETMQVMRVPRYPALDNDRFCEPERQLAALLDQLPATSPAPCRSH